jgi:hypothetical protein
MRDEESDATGSNLVLVTHSVSSMISRLRSWVYGSVPVEFKSAYDLEESVRRLTAATGGSIFRARVVGTVTQSRVFLLRFVPFDFFLNIAVFIRPVFTGQFEQWNDHVVLKGRFKIHPVGRMYLVSTLGLMPLAVVIVPAHVMGRVEWLFVLFALGALSLSIALVWLGRWLSRNDLSCLSQFIVSALSKESLSSELKSTSPEVSDRKTAAAAKI